MNIQKVTDPSFGKYGKVIQNIDFSSLVQALNEQTPSPEDVVYEPSVEALEALPVFEELRTKAYGELPIQIGFCNGKNHLLNALEYHRSSEINVGGTDAILLVGLQRDITKEFTYDTSLVEAVVLPRGTNLPLEEKHEGWEDALITAKNKWLIGHAEGGLPEGSHIGLIGENVSVK